MINFLLIVLFVFLFSAVSRLFDKGHVNFDFSGICYVSTSRKAPPLRMTSGGVRTYHSPAHVVILSISGFSGSAKETARRIFATKEQLPDIDIGFFICTHIRRSGCRLGGKDPSNVSFVMPIKNCASG